MVFRKWLATAACVAMLGGAGTAWAAPSRDELYTMILDLQTQITAQQNTITALNDELTALKENPSVKMGQYVSIVDGSLNGVSGPNVIFEGVNLHLRSGGGSTEEQDLPALTGLGNLIIGYNELPDYSQPLLEGDRGGSHNFVMGKENRFSSFVGLVHGENNIVRNQTSATIAGHANQVPGDYSAAIAGHYNIVTGTEAAAIAGNRNTVDGTLSAIIAGEYNLTAGHHSAISGGAYNTANGTDAVVSGGVEVDANEDYAAATVALEATLGTVGAQLDALEDRLDVTDSELVGVIATVSDPNLAAVTALGPYVRVDANEINGVSGPNVIFEGVNLHLRSGGGSTEEQDLPALTGLGNLIIGYNELPDYSQPLLEGDRGGSHNFVMGKENRFASFVGLVHGENNIVRNQTSATIAGHANQVPGDYSAAIAGHYNIVSGTEAAAIAGNRNVVDGTLSAVTAGEYNQTTGYHAAVSGGASNAASGANSVVSGGVEEQAVNDYEWKAPLP